MHEPSSLRWDLEQSPLAPVGSLKKAGKVEQPMGQVASTQNKAAKISWAFSLFSVFLSFFFLIEI